MPKITTSTKQPFFLTAHFFPLFWVQFLAAFNDNLYKNAMVMLIAFQLSQSSEQTGLYITLAAGIFILPFFLFSSFAGQLADHFPKSILIQKIQLSEIFIMATGAVGFLTMQLEWLFLALFLMGTQSAFFGPIKYSVLPEVLGEPQLLRGNAWFSGSTFIAILLGTIMGGSLVMMDNGAEIISVVVLSMSIIGYLFSLKIPATKQACPEIQIDKNVLRSTWQIVQLGRQHKASFFAVLAISWFWFIGAVLLSQIPTFVKYTLQANEEVVIAFLTLFSVGIAVGAGLISKLLNTQVSLRFHPWLLILMSVFLLLAVWVSNSIHAIPDSPVVLMGLFEFLTLWPQNLSLLFLFALAVMGGAYIVPLYTQLQIKTPETSRARIVAVNNIINALLMVLSSVLIMVGFLFDLSLPSMLLILGVFNLLVAGWFVRNSKESQ
ncbi:MAG: MFS transporter [Pseudomonadota bacterium]|nr:MFS transporter [Pseudomonadota bacterium]